MGNRQSQPPSISLESYGIDPSSVAGSHKPRLHPQNQAIECRECGEAKKFNANNAASITQTLTEFKHVPCNTGKETAIGGHKIQVISDTQAKYSESKQITCKECGRSATVQSLEAVEAIAAEFRKIDCCSEFEPREFVTLLRSDYALRPSTDQLGIYNWSVVGPKEQGKDLVSKITHSEFNHTIYIGHSTTPQSIGEVRLTAREDPAGSTIEFIELETIRPASASVQSVARDIVEFLVVTDSYSARDVENLLEYYKEARRKNRSEWIEKAYELAESDFEQRINASPAEFAVTFDLNDEKEALRRMTPVNGIEDISEENLIAEWIGEPFDYWGVFEFVSEISSWNPPAN